MAKPKLYIHVVGATHFLRWELPEFSKYFDLVDRPRDDAALLSFGPDALEEASTLPALKRFAIVFPGFSFNPVHNEALRECQIPILNTRFEIVFIYPGPLQIAYKEVRNIKVCQPSVDTDLIGFSKYRRQVNNLVHVSNDSAQKDWQRSEEIMRLTGLDYEVYPPRDRIFYLRHFAASKLANKLRKLIGRKEMPYLHYSYVKHQKVIQKYDQYDGFVHVAAEVTHDRLLDGKYTASFIEAGLTGSILFWHDTFNLGNNLETVFNLSVEPKIAAREILDISKSIDVYKHSQLTRQEMLETFNVRDSVRVRAEAMLEIIS